MECLKISVPEGEDWGQVPGVVGVGEGLSKVGFRITKSVVCGTKVAPSVDIRHRNFRGLWSANWLLFGLRSTKQDVGIEPFSCYG